MSPNLFDIHCHLNLPEFASDEPLVLQQTLSAGCWVNNVGADLVTSRRAVEIANRGDLGVWATVGFHPTDSELVNGDDWQELAGLARQAKVVAIGECGLEYYSRGTEKISDQTKENQKNIFRRQIELALELDKPLMVHCRPSTGSQDAYEDAVQILGEYQAVSDHKLRGDFHFFAGNWETAQKCLALGFYLSFTGVVTFTHDYDEVIKNMPLDRLVAETDSPYVAPAPYRGKRCEPLYVAEVVRGLAELRGLPYLEMAKISVQNGRQLFGV